MMERLLLWATAVVFVAFGLWGLFNPAAMTANFGIRLDSPDAKAMIRASYGGFLIGEGLLFAWCAMSAERIHFGLIAIVLLTGPILLSRLYGILFDGATSPYHKAYIGVELLGIVLALSLLRRAS